MTDPPDAIIFDYGSVLVGPLDTDRFEQNLNTLAEEYGFDTGDELWRHIYVSTAWEQAKRGRISHEALWTDRLRVLGINTREGRTAFKHRLFEHWGLFPRMRDLVYTLQDANFRLAVLSNTSRKGFRQYLAEKRGFEDVFEVVISSAEVGYAKPEPEIYQITLRALDLPGERTLFIDDQARNTSAAEDLGMQTIVFTGYADLRPELEARGIL